MKAYYFDNVEGDQRLPHHNPDLPPVGLQQLESCGVRYWYIPIDSDGNWEQAIDKVAEERSYKNRDIINVSKEGLGDQYEAKLKIFFAEHLHEDEEIRYILDGAGFFDIREPNKDQWIRVFVDQGDLLVVPAGIYHRFTLDEGNYIKAMRLFKEEPKWTPHNRSAETDSNPHRVTYLHSVQAQ
ncbi:1,2-dihydroxy-3-keto-5-methylthiopentene dioxygenase [Serendipita sp. 411]|nr:1,2-dihydroxy-3-keto-5-methylthiopentene dioxygenase [Serendipita sp. 411]